MIVFITHSLISLNNRLIRVQDRVLSIELQFKHITHIPMCRAHSYDMLQFESMFQFIYLYRYIMLFSLCESTAQVVDFVCTVHLSISEKNDIYNPAHDGDMYSHAFKKAFWTLLTKHLHVGV